MHAALRPSTSLDQLHRAGMPVDALDGYGRTALYAAATAGSSEAVGWLLRHGADVDLPNAYDGRTALHAACAAGQEEAAAALIGGGAKLTLVDGGGLTPIDCAAIAGHRRLVRLLFDAQFLRPGVR